MLHRDKRGEACGCRAGGRRAVAPTQTPLVSTHPPKIAIPLLGGKNCAGSYSPLFLPHSPTPDFLISTPRVKTRLTKQIHTPGQKQQIHTPSDKANPPPGVSRLAV